MYYIISYTTRCVKSENHNLSIKQYILCIKHHSYCCVVRIFSIGPLLAKKKCLFVFLLNQKCSKKHSNNIIHSNTRLRHPNDTFKTLLS